MPIQRLEPEATGTVLTDFIGRVVVGVVPPLGVANGSSWASSSSAVCHRSAGRFARHFMITASSSAGRWADAGTAGPAAA